MVYYPRNSNHRLIEREPRRRAYYSQQQSGRGFEDYHHAPPAKPTSWDDYRGDYDDYRRDNYDYLPGNYDGYRRNYCSPTLNRHLRRNISNVVPKSLIRRSNWTVRSYKPYQSSSSKIHCPNYGIERDQKERGYPIPPRGYNLKRTSLPRKYIKFNGNREGNNYHGRKMQQYRRIKSYNIQIRNRRFAVTTAASKQHSPRLPPPPPLPESEFMMEDHNDSPALSSPSCMEEGELRSCSPVLMCSPDNTGLLEFTGVIAGST